MKRKNIHLSSEISPWTFLLLFALSFLLRILFPLLIDVPSIPDAEEYLRTGAVLFEKGVFTNHKMMPLYPIIIYASGLLGSHIFIDLLLSSATSIIITLLSWEIFRNSRIAVITGIAYAFYPFSIYYASAGLTESSFVFLVLTSFLFLYRKQMWLGAFFLVLSILIRPTLDYLNPLLLIVFAMVLHQSSMRSSLFSLMKYVVIYLLLLSPWWLHNYNQYGHFVRLNLGFGEVLYGGNNPHNPSGRALPMLQNHSLAADVRNPYRRNEILIKEAKDYIKIQPIAFLKTSLRRLLVLFNPLPNHERYQSTLFKLISFISVVPLYLGSMLFLWQRRLKDLKIVLPIFLIILYITAVHSVTIASIRYRFPIEPFLILLSIAGFYTILKRKQAE